MKLRDAILNQFESDIAIALIEFGKSLSRIDADVLIFMARKSLRLYDILLHLGIPPIERILVSDRILDMRMDPIISKKVSLIDDSIILGTTLAKAKRRLETEANASVKVHAFCVDTKWWSKELIEPDSISLYLDDRQVMSFCAAEVRAMSLVPRPYLVDFPISLPIRIRLADSQCLLSSVQWTSHRISTELQERNNVSVLTFFPSELVLSETFSGMAEQLIELLEIVKVRAFARTYEDIHWLQLVPIVTLKPIRENDLRDLLGLLLERISATSGKELKKLLYFAHKPRAQDRLVQYILSAALGSCFMETISKSVDSLIEKGYDQLEAERHYGPWLSTEMAQVGLHALSALRISNNEAAVSLKQANLPQITKDWANDFMPIENESQAESVDSWDYINIITDFAEIFLGLYDKREIPARLEAQKLGKKVLDATPSQAPNRDRLEEGLPWTSIVEYLRSKYRMELTNEIKNAFSLVLDLCNDLGISVPVTCFREGVVFRAYRYGEDVRFSDAELALAYDVVKGILSTTHRDSVTRLVLEKLLVLLIKVGAAKKFLEPLWGPGGMEGTVRIGFNLKGALCILTHGPKQRLDRDIWLSKYLVKRGVLSLDQLNNQFKLGKQVEGNFVVPNAPDDAFELGCIVGMLLKSSEDPSRHDAPLDAKSLTVLASCWNPRHAAAALQVELSIFKEWFEHVGRKSLQNINWMSQESISNVLNLLLEESKGKGKGHEAVHSAKMKYVGYKAGDNERKVQECADYLEKKQMNEILARKWKSYWSAVTASRATGEKETFDPWIDKAATICWEIATSLSGIEISLTSHLAELESHDKQIRKGGLQKLFSYYQDLVGVGLSQPTFVSRLVKRFQEIDSQPAIPFDHKQAFAYSLEHIENLIPTIADVVETMEPIIEEFGRISGRHDYKYMVWYDIKDSTGTQTGWTGSDLEKYRNQVRGYKQWVNNRFHQLSIIARKDKGEIYCYNGDASSMNDMKHVFVSGKFSRRYLSDVLSMLMQGTLAFSNVRLRVYFVPCNFAGTSAFRREFAPEIQGERFWEHWSRLQKNSATFESQYSDEKSFLLVATNDLAKSLELPPNIKWNDTKEENVTSEIELLSRATAVRYGELSISL